MIYWKAETDDFSILSPYQSPDVRGLTSGGSPVSEAWVGLCLISILTWCSPHKRQCDEVWPSWQALPRLLSLSFSSHSQSGELLQSSLSGRLELELPCLGLLMTRSCLELEADIVEEAFSQSMVVRLSDTGHTCSGSNSNSVTCKLHDLRQVAAPLGHIASLSTPVS